MGIVVWLGEQNDKVSIAEQEQDLGEQSDKEVDETTRRKVWRTLKPHQKYLESLNLSSPVRFCGHCGLVNTEKKCDSKCNVRSVCIV